MLEPLFNRSKINGKARLSADPHLRVVAFMSGEGSNLIKILEREEELKKENANAYRTVLIVSNNYESQAVKIAKQFNKPVFIRDIKTFYSNLNLDYKNTNYRYKFDCEIAKILTHYKTDCVVLAGYNCKVSQLITNFLTINIHPADLRIKNEEGQRKYTGLNAVKKAIDKQEKYVRSTTHIANDEIDNGQLLMIGPAITNEASLNYKTLQKKLKEKSEHIIYPLTLELIAKGIFKQDKNKKIYFGNFPIPNGLQI